MATAAWWAALKRRHNLAKSKDEATYRTRRAMDRQEAKVTALENASATSKKGKRHRK